MGRDTSEAAEAFARHCESFVPCGELCTTRPSRMERRLDSLARLVVGSEVCSALAFDLSSKKLVMATNKSSTHGQQSLQVVDEVCYEWNGKNILQVTISVNIGNASGHVTRHDTLEYRRKTSSDEFTCTQNPEILVSFPPNDLIPQKCEWRYTLWNTLTGLRPRPGDPDTVIRRLMKRTIHEDPFQRRACTILEYMGLVLLTEGKEHKAIRPRLRAALTSRLQELIRQTFSWEATRRVLQLKQKLASGRSAKDRVSNAMSHLYNSGRDWTAPEVLDDVLKWSNSLAAMYVQWRAENPTLHVHAKNLLEWWPDESCHSRLDLGLPPESYDTLKQLMRRYLIDFERLVSYARDVAMKWHALRGQERTFWKVIRNATRLNNISSVVVQPFNASAQGPDNSSCDIHAELQVVEHLRIHGQTPEYVATSLLCCLKCQVAVKAATGAKCRTRGCHGHCYGKWVLPTSLMADEHFMKSFLGNDLFESSWLGKDDVVKQKLLEDIGKHKCRNSRATSDDLHADLSDSDLDYTEQQFASVVVLTRGQKKRLKKRLKKQ